MTTELNSFEEAAAIAMAEQAEATASDAEASLPEVEAEASVDDGQAEVEITEQADSQTDAEEVTEEDESLFGDIEIEEASLETAAPQIADDTAFELPGVEGQVTLAELKDGYLRQSDYTRKTQEVAEARKTNEKAVGLWEALRANPEGVVRQLAAQVGLVDENAAPVKAVEFSPITTQEEMQAEINSRVEQALAEHPDVVEAQTQNAVRLIHGELDRLGSEAGVSLSDKDKEVILREAQRRGVSDLELVFNNLMSAREKKAQERSALKDAAPARPTGTTSSTPKKEYASSFEEAVEMAKLELGQAQ